MCYHFTYKYFQRCLIGCNVKKNLHIVITPDKTISESQSNKVHVQRVSFSSKKKKMSFQDLTFSQDLNKAHMLHCIVMTLNPFPSLGSQSLSSFFMPFFLLKK